MKKKNWTAAISSAHWTSGKAYDYSWQPKLLTRRPRKTSCGSKCSPPPRWDPATKSTWSSPRKSGQLADHRCPVAWHLIADHKVIGGQADHQRQQLAPTTSAALATGWTQNHRHAKSHQTLFIKQEKVWWCMLISLRRLSQWQVKKLIWKYQSSSTVELKQKDRYRGQRFRSIFG